MIEIIKKYGLLVLSVLLFVTFFTVSWHRDRLFNLFFIFYFPVYFILIGCFIDLLVFNIVFLIINKGFANFVSLVVLGLLVVVVLFFPFRYAKVKFELALYDKDWVKIVDMVKNNELQNEPGKSREYVLPDEYKKLSSDGNIIVYKNNEDGQVIGFWVFRGMLSGYTQLMYSSDGEELIRRSISIDTTINKIEMLHENWYYVEME